VLGDLALDVVLAPERRIETGTDVPGRVMLRQGGSAAATARWVARLGARSMLVCAVGRDDVGRALVRSLEADDVTVRAVRVTGAPTARIGVLVGPTGERSFVADRGAATHLRPDDLRQEWFAGVALLHLPAYSLMGEPVAAAARQAIDLVRGGGGLVSLDLASIGPLMAGGRRAALGLVRSVAPDIVFATAAEARALIGRDDLERLLDLAPIAVVKQGPRGVTTLAREGDSRLRFEFATPAVLTGDTTGAGDAFDAGFLVSWLGSQVAGRSIVASLRRAALAGHRAAARQLGAPRSELRLG
jgi:sugar/nucleoside kinase (ribokinase family)